jgi:hypothetical protein
MAEGLLDGVLGGEEEKVDPTDGGTEPIVAAVAASLPPPAAPALAAWVFVALFLALLRIHSSASIRSSIGSGFFGICTAHDRIALLSTLKSAAINRIR